jgi:hypothetical protein
MKKYIYLLLITISSEGFSQQTPPAFSFEKEAPKYFVQLNETVILESRVFKNDTLRYHYNQMKHYVKIVMPYANAAVKMFNEIDMATANASKKERRKFIKSKEKEIKSNFEDKLTSLNITQGRLLVKIVNRQLKTNCYDIVKELKNPVTAVYYQSWAKLNGINLNEQYNPEDNLDLEQILTSLGY